MKYLKLLPAFIGLFFTSMIYGQNYSGGSGIQSDPYLIANKADLKYLSENSSESNKHFKQIADIAFSPSDFQSGGNFYNGGKGFLPIAPFKGSYDGASHTISNLYINDTSKKTGSIGFFSEANGSAEIKNLGLLNVNIIAKCKDLGAIVGYTSGIVTNCFATGSVSNNAGSYTGGLIGSSTFAQISYCYFSGKINSSSYSTGGLVGDVNFGKINQCYSLGKVSVDTISLIAGGLIGRSTFAYELNNIFSRDSVIGNKVSLAGLIGDYNKGSDLPSVTNSYSAGFFIGTGSSVGGLIAENAFGEPLSNCFWDTQTSGTTSSSGGTGKTTSEMKTQSTFTSATWDFIGETTNGTQDIWYMNANLNNGYPTFVPVIVSAPNAKRCGPGSVTITANTFAGTAKWYDQASGGTLLSSNNNYTTPSLTNNTTYYVEATNGYITTPRVAVTVTINPLVVTSQGSYANLTCFNDSTGSATISVSGGTPAFTYDWTPGNPQGDGTATVSGLAAGNWTCTVTDVNGCSSSTSFALTEPPQLVVSSIGNAQRCDSGMVAISATPNAGTISWFLSSSGGTALTNGAEYSISGNSLTINNLTATTTYYAEVQNNTCKSPSRTAVIATYKQNPNVNVSAFGSTAGAQATSGVSYQWLDCNNSNALIIGATQQFYPANNSGNYAVKITSIENGCSDTSNCVSLTASVPVVTSDLDLSFNTTGILKSTFPNEEAVALAVAVQPDGKIIAAGSIQDTVNLISRIAVTRYTSVGVLDTTFGVAGKVIKKIANGNSELYDIAIQNDGKIVMCGFSTNGTNQDVLLVRLNNDGSFDNTFGANGVVSSDLLGKRENAYSLILQTVANEQRIIVAGTQDNMGLGTMLLARYKSNGNLDSTFGSNGMRLPTFGDSFRDYAWEVKTDANGKIIIAGTGGAAEIALARFDMNGGVDNTFGVNGQVMQAITAGGAMGTEVTCMAIQKDGKIVVGGYVLDMNIVNNFMAARFNADGSLDTTSFGNGAGYVVYPYGSYDSKAYAINIQADGKILLSGVSTSPQYDLDFTTLRLNSNGVVDSTFGTNGGISTAVGSLDDDAFAATIQPDGKLIVAGGYRTADGRDFALVRYDNGCKIPVVLSTTADSLCGSGIMNLSASASAGNVYWYNAQTGGNIVNIGNAFNTPVLNNSTNYWVEADSAGCKSVSRNKLTAQVNQIPSVATTINGLTITATASGLMYQWIDCANNNQPIAGATNKSFTATAIGSYAVIVDNGSCSDTSDCVVISDVGIDKLNENAKILVYPNPSQGQFTVNGLAKGTVVEVYNVLGGMVLSTIAIDSLMEINLNDRPNGVYFIKFDGKSHVRIVKQN